MDRRGFLLAAAAGVLTMLGVTAARAAQRLTVGARLQSSPGTWTGTPTSYSYAWQHQKNGATWVTVQTGASNTYQVAQADVGSVLRVLVTAYNPTPSLPKASQPTRTVRA